MVGESIGVICLRVPGDLELRDAICLSINVTTCIVSEGGDLVEGACTDACDAEASEIEVCMSLVAASSADMLPLTVVEGCRALTKKIVSVSYYSASIWPRGD